MRHLSIIIWQLKNALIKKIRLVYFTTTEAWSIQDLIKLKKLLMIIQKQKKKYLSRITCTKQDLIKVFVLDVWDQNT